MPLIGFIGDDGRDYPFDKALALCEAGDPAFRSVPFALLKGMVDGTQDRGDSISATSILHCLRGDYLKRREPYYARPETQYAMFRGTLFHSLLEANAPKNARVEERHRKLVSGIEISGQFDSLVAFEDPEKKRWRLLDWKGLALDTPIPTPTGWTTMGDLSVGDYVFDRDGIPCRVVGKSEPTVKPDYRITFANGSSVVCDEDHLWVVKAGAYAREERVLRASQIADRLSAGKNVRVPIGASLITGLVECQPELPVDPYIYGAWLGDGSRSSNRATCRPDVFDEIEKLGVETGTPIPEGTASTRTLLRLRKTMTEAGMLNGEKRILPMYLRAPVPKRIALLQGLMDTDGTWNKARKRAVLDLTNANLSDDAYELMTSLGFKVHRTSFQHFGFGKWVTVYRLDFSVPKGGINPFRISRKADLVRHPEMNRNSYMHIESVESVDPVVTQCISVDSPTNTYLFGRDMLVTHNTSKSLPKYDTPYSSHIAQLNIYRWLLDLPVDNVDVEVWYFSMEGYKRTYLKDGNGKSGVNQIWSDAKVEAFITERIVKLKASFVADTPMPYALVPDEDKWECEYCPVRQRCSDLSRQEAEATWRRNAGLPPIGTPVDVAPEWQRLVDGVFARLENTDGSEAAGTGRRRSARSTRKGSGDE